MEKAYDKLRKKSSKEAWRIQNKSPQKPANKKKWEIICKLLKL